MRGIQGGRLEKKKGLRLRGGNERKKRGIITD